MEKTNKTIFITTSFEGVHRYPSAPEGVKFLASDHRHTFGVRMEVEVYHDDRELEFILFKRLVNGWLLSQQNDDGVWEMGAMSCEMVANWLIEKVREGVARGSERYIKVTIDEDGENGAVIEVTPGGMVTNKPTVQKPLTLSAYQEKAYKNIQAHDSHKEEVMHWAIGLGEEAGETLSVIKHRYYGGGYDLADFVGELGDTLWHIAALCTVMDISLEDVAMFNLAKLEHRYPSDSFDYERSLNRERLGTEFKESEAYKELMNKINKK